MNTNHYYDVIKQLIWELPVVQKWSIIADLVDQSCGGKPLEMQLPFVMCDLECGEPLRAAPGVAAIVLTQVSIILVDDILDDDPRGLYHEIGAGQAANLALACQTAAFDLLTMTDCSDAAKVALCETISAINSQTALAQRDDTNNTDGDEMAYWRIMAAKSAPFYAGSAQMGAILGRATAERRELYYDFGHLYGRIVQLHDDLKDAMTTPAKPDWQRPNNNLLMLYAKTAAHPQRERFLRLLDQVTYDPIALREAQQIIIQSGALGYFAYHLTQLHKESKKLVAKFPNPEHHQVQKILSGFMAPLTHMQEKAMARRAA